MHNLVKEATEITFNELGNDLQVAKEVTLKNLGADLDYKYKSSIEACSSIGHLLNEVDANLYYKVNAHPAAILWSVWFWELGFCDVADG